MSDDEISKDNPRVRAFAEENAKWHVGGASAGHAWPCGVWFPARKNEPMLGSWRTVIQHGLVPLNTVLIFADEDDQKDFLQRAQEFGVIITADFTDIQDEIENIIKGEE